MHRKFFTDNTGFYRQIFKLVLPIVIQNLLSAAVSSADIVMLNYVGQSSISAVSLASQYASVLFMVYYGLGTGATMLCAQYFGKGDMHAIEVVEGIALRFSLVISLAFASVALLIPELMMKVFTNDPELITLGASYLRFMSITYLCWGITEVYLAVLRSIGRVTVSMALNVLAFSPEYHIKCRFYLRSVRRAEAWCKGCRFSDCHFPYRRTDLLLLCFHFQ